MRERGVAVLVDEVDDDGDDASHCSHCFRTIDESHRGRPSTCCKPIVDALAAVETGPVAKAVRALATASNVRRCVVV
jgi:hypothetical protein